MSLEELHKFQLTIQLAEVIRYAPLAAKICRKFGIRFVSFAGKHFVMNIQLQKMESGSAPNTLNTILQRFGLKPDARMPIDIPIGRNDLARLFAELGFTIGAEIGVERGLYTKVLCQANPQATIYAIDAWRAYSGYREHVSQEKLDGFYAEAVERVMMYPSCRLMRRFSMDAVEDFEDGSLDFVYIDANHEFQHVVNDLAEWSKKVRPGGIVAGHDYKKDKKPGALFHVPFAVGGYTQAYGISPWFVLRGDRAASWMWVRQ